MIKTIPKKKKCKKAKWLSEEVLQIAEKREAKGKGEKIYPFECRVPKTLQPALIWSNIHYYDYTTVLQIYPTVRIMSEKAMAPHSSTLA